MTDERTQPDLHGPCPGRHKSVEVGDDWVLVRCDFTTATYWFKRCSFVTKDDTRCPYFAKDKRLFCINHRNERA